MHSLKLRTIKQRCPSTCYELIGTFLHLGWQGEKNALLRTAAQNLRYWYDGMWWSSSYRSIACSFHCSGLSFPAVSLCLRNHEQHWAEPLAPLYRAPSGFSWRLERYPSKHLYQILRAVRHTVWWSTGGIKVPCGIGRVQPSARCGVILRPPHTKRTDAAVTQIQGRLLAMVPVSWSCCSSILRCNVQGQRRIRSA